MSESRVRENRTHGSTGGGWKRDTTTCHRASPRPSMAGLCEWVLNSRKVPLSCENVDC